MASLFELAGSVKEAIFAALHAVTAKPFRVAPPEAVVYQVLIKNRLHYTSITFSALLRRHILTL
jgi:hypothetical protein